MQIDHALPTPRNCSLTSIVITALPRFSVVSFDPIACVAMTKNIIDMIRLQQPYSLKEIPEVQQYLTFTLDVTRFTLDADLLHRRR